MGTVKDIGWSFPPHFDYPENPDKDFAYGRVTMTTGEADINGSLAVLFSTRLGERLFRPDFGASVVDYQFKPMDSGTANRLSRMIQDAVRKYEKRILVKGVDVSGSNVAEGNIRIVLRYSIREDYAGDGGTHTFVYDFD